MAALEIGRRRRDEELPTTYPDEPGSADVYNLLRGQMIDLPHEEFWVLLLNRANRVMDTIKVSRGGTCCDGGRCKISYAIGFTAIGIGCYFVS